MRRISEKDTIKAISYDKDGKYMATIYDGGFRNIRQVISALERKSAGWTRKISTIFISNEDKGWYGTFDRNGKKID